jgi:hypothetical protein
MTITDFAERFPIKDTPMYADLVRHHTAMISAEEKAWWAEFYLSAAKRRIASLEKELNDIKKASGFDHS